MYVSPHKRKPKKEEVKPHENKEEPIPEVACGNRWELEYDRLRSLGYTHELAKAVISKQRINELFSDPGRRW
jgi:hypothetical protein